jgi:hypothetical protein
MKTGLRIKNKKGKSEWGLGREALIIAKFKT